MYYLSHHFLNKRFSRPLNTSTSDRVGVYLRSLSVLIPESLSTVYIRSLVSSPLLWLGEKRPWYTPDNARSRLVASWSLNFRSICRVVGPAG